MPVLNYSVSLTSTIPKIRGYLSADGRYVVSLPDVSGGVQNDITLLNISTGEYLTILPPVGWNDGLKFPALSSDSRSIYFSAFDKLNNQYQTFVKNIETGELQIGSANVAGQAGNFGTYGSVRLSENAQYLFFSTKSSNIIAGDSNNKIDLFRKNLHTGEVMLVSEKSNGGFSSGDSFQPVISENGRYVIFYSSSVDLLAPNDVQQYNSGNYYVKDMETGELRYLDKKIPFGSYGAIDVAFSSDGSKIAYSGKMRGDNVVHVYMQDRESQVTTQISNNKDANSLGIDANLITATESRFIFGNSHHLYSLSADGTKVTMMIYLDNIDQNAKIFVQKDLITNKLTMLSAPDRDIGFPVVSLDGSTLTSFYRVGNKDGKNIFSIDTIDVNGNGSLTGENKLYPSAAGEVLFGGAGNDYYYITPIGATVIEQADAGIDTVISLIENYEMPDNVENIQLGGVINHVGMMYTTIPRNVNGNTSDNVIRANGYNNIIQAKEGNDTIYGYGGDDVINGGAGSDVVHFSNRYNEYNIRSEGGVILVSKYTSVNSTSFSSQTVLHEVERIQFYDRALSSSADINASQAYRIYQAAFDRKPDAGGLGFWVKQIDNGSTLETIATGFMQSAEFKSTYGENPSNKVLVEKFYQNVLHRAPDAGGLNYWTNLLDTKQLSGAQVLASFSESPENQAALVGVLDAWFSFTPYA